MENFQSEQINELAAAMVEAQKKFNGVKATESGYENRYTYATLQDCLDVAKEPLTENGLCVIQTMRVSPEGNNILVTDLIHKSGQWKRSEILIKPAKADAQSAGSAISYARRYAFNAIVGLAQVDDDAQEAMPKGKIPAPPQQKPAQNTSGQRVISPAQVARLSAIIQGSDWTRGQVQALALKLVNKKSSNDLSIAEYDLVCKTIQEKTPEEFGLENVT